MCLKEGCESQKSIKAMHFLLECQLENSKNSNSLYLPSSLEFFEAYFPLFLPPNIASWTCWEILISTTQAHRCIAKI